MLASESASQSKISRLRALSTESGIIAALAIDQRKSLRRMIAGAAGMPMEAVSDAQLSEFKSAVTAALTPFTSAVLLDPEFGLEARDRRAPGCGLLLAYEMDGYENPRPHKMLALLPDQSVARLRDLGADGIKILLTYCPAGDLAANRAKQDLVRAIGDECDAAGLPFFLEPVVYHPCGVTPRTKPDLVIRTIEEFSKPQYKVDVLKVEFPLSAACVGEAFTRSEAVSIFRRADQATNLPYIYLSAGVSLMEFINCLEFAAEAGARYSGVLCGRATWQDGATIYARSGLPTLLEWLGTAGTGNLRALNTALRVASSCFN